MFTVEILEDHSIITVLDDTGEYEDVQVILCDDDKVYLRQWHEGQQRFTVLSMNYKVFKEITLGLNEPEGAYHTRVQLGDKHV